MKTPKFIKNIILACACIFSVSLYVAADGEEPLREGEKIGGGYVEDASVSVPANAYVTFSTVYNGKRYYLGVDTVRAQAATPKDTVTWYEGPNYAAMWIAGPLWSYNGNPLPNKDYTRTIKSVWLKERVDRDRCLMRGTNYAGYSSLVLRHDSLATMWHTAKDMTAQSKYIQGFVYDLSEINGIEAYRYLTFDPVYGFSRLREERPAVSQRISVWDRTTGSDLIYNTTPNNITIGYNPDCDTIQAITGQVIYYEDIDRFRSRFDQTDIYTRRSTPITNQETLLGPPYNLSGFYEWKSNPIGPTSADTASYNGNSIMQYYTITGYDVDENPIWGWQDTALVHARKTGFTLKGNVWHDTIYAGKAPLDRPSARFLHKPAGGGAPTEGDYANQNDWLYTVFTCAGKPYRDSILVVRQTFHEDPSTKLSLINEPENHVFPYSEAGQTIPVADTACSFDVTANYVNKTVIRSVGNAWVDEQIGEQRTLDMVNTPCYRDTIWDLTDPEHPVVDHVVLYDTLTVEALNIDGTPCTWVDAIYLPARNQIRVKIQPYNDGATANRTAQIRYTYRYWHSGAAGDQAVDSRVIWIAQEWKGAHDDELYSFNHRGELGADGLQAVHTKKNTLYAIPQEPLSLPIHRDHWGYYRWFSYDDAKRDNDLNYAGWTFSAVPTNTRDSAFMPINFSNTAASRGRWDVIKDSEHPGNTYFGADHFTQWTATPIPAVNYPQSSTKNGKVACDVSAYYNIGTEGAIGSLTSMTEPTLSYRHIFDIQPAKTRADQLATVVGDGSGANWLEQYTIVAPAGRAFSLQPQCPISHNGAGSEEIDEEHLQYIYYFRPTDDGSDPNMGQDPGSNYDKADTYNRIGKNKQTAASPYYRTRLIPASEISSMRVGDTMRVVMVNPRKSSGYIVGKESGGSTGIYSFSSNFSSVTTEAQLRTYVENNILKNGNTPYLQPNYILKLTKVADGTLRIIHTANKEPLTIAYFTIIVTRWWYMDWTLSGHSASGQANITYDIPGSWNDNNRISGLDNALIKLHYNQTYQNPITHTINGYLTACDVDWRDRYSENMHVADKNATEGSAANQAWCFYEILDPEDAKDHFETPVWERSTDGNTWKQVAHWDYSTNTGVADSAGYSMTADGVLHIPASKFPNANTPIFYRLRTEHFQLAKFVGLTRDADTQMLKNGTIISEEEIYNDYNIIYKLPMEDWPAPGTTDVVAYDDHFPWDFTELSYHYPLSHTDIPADRRVFSGEMPGKGEYAFINKFVVPEGPTTENAGEVYECLSGAENGYMLCINAAGKRTTIMNFDYNQLSCSGQQIYLVANFCDPVNNNYNPQITADLEGSNDGVTWTRIYRYKSGEIPWKAHNDNPWYQMALPIDRDYIKGYSRFRCRAEINGGPNRNAHLLIDRVRFIERARAFSVFQNKATCVKEDSVTVLIRLNYHADSVLYQPGKLVAYQFQKHTPSGYVPMLASKSDGAGGYIALDNTTTPKLEVFPGYIKDAFTATESVTKDFLKTTAGNDYGYVMIPEAKYDPSLSNTVEGQSGLRAALIEQAITKLGLTGAAADTRRGFIDERANIRTFDQVVAHDYVDFGGVSTPHIKSFVKVGDTWLLYIICRLPVSATDNSTFRIGMTVMNNLNDKPTFSEEGCATFRILNVKQTTSLLVNGSAWGNATRAQATAADTLLPANETQRASIKLTVTDKVGTHPTKNPRCKFDLLHASADVRPFLDEEDDTEAGNAAFIAKYGCTRTQFVDAMEAFRIDDDRNPCRAIADWSQVTPEALTKTGRLMDGDDGARAIYNRLNHLIELGLLELALDYRDIYMGDRADSYFYLLPVPATGLFDVEEGSSTGTDTTWNASVCNDTIWLELHSKEPLNKLRFGYDSRVGDTFVVPVIRASRTDANGIGGNTLKVRVAYITREVDRATVIGWQATKLIETDDPDWNEADPSDAFYYQQDKNVIGASNLSGYYTNGSVIEFTPKAGVTFPLKAGYWYRFEAPFYNTTGPDVAYTTDESNPANIKGHSQFILAIAPDTVRWTPAFTDKANYWNDDHNWTAIINGEDSKDMIALVPMGDTRVIIPQVSEGMLPIASDVVAAKIDTLHYGYTKNTCKEILFKPKSQMLGQEKLTYSKAFVDVPMKTGNWQTFSPALNHIYSGDMYIPSDLSTDKDFLPGVFTTPSGTSWDDNPRVWPYAFYQGFYNSTVPVPFYNTDLEGTPVNNETMQQSKNSVDWVKTPSLDMPYTPGKAMIITGYDDTDKDGNDIVVRLPKQESEYHGYGMDPNGSGKYIAGPAIPMQTGNVPRPSFGSLEHNLAYDQYATGFDADNGLTYTLTNATESNIFFFGNPTMSLIDVYQLCVDNADQLDHDGGAHKFTAYRLMDEANANYSTMIITGKGQYFVAPQRAVGLIANAANTTAKSLTLKLTPKALVAITGDGTIVSHDDLKGGSSAPRRMTQELEIFDERKLYITAATEVTDEWGGSSISKAYVTLGESMEASREFRKGEDAVNISSGLNYYSDESFSTPLTMYTIAANQALMLDMRDTLHNVPLVFATLDNKYSYDNYTLLSFATEGLWNRPLYLFDALTNDSVLIRNGLRIAVQTPLNNQLRYFINGYRAPQNTNPGVATGVEETVNGERAAVNGQTSIYDLLGRKIMTLGEYDLLHNVQLPTGVYIIQRGNQTERMLIK